VFESVYFYQSIDDVLPILNPALPRYRVAQIAVVIVYIHSAALSVFRQRRSVCVIIDRSRSAIDLQRKSVDRQQHIAACFDRPDATRQSNTGSPVRNTHRP